MRQWRDRFKDISLDQATAVTLMLLDTVAQAHAAGILHRDIKPENIIMRDGDVSNPVLVDFGIAFDRSRERPKSLTREGDELGNRFLSLPELNGVARISAAQFLISLWSLAFSFTFLQAETRPN